MVAAGTTRMAFGTIVASPGCISPGHASAPEMSRDDSNPRSDRKALPQCLAAPQISIVGEIDADLVRSFLDQLSDAEKNAAESDDGAIAMELTTLGGDAELARRMVLEIEAARKRLKHRFLFVGKTVVYSAGATIMSAFPRADRYLTADATLLIHCRQLEKTIEIDGPIRASLAKLEALKAEIEMGLRLEETNFRSLIEGSDIDLDELLEKALYNWYLTAEEAARRGLVNRLFDLPEAVHT
jgi:ATP-dependent protease ClpP protease subunit